MNDLHVKHLPIVNNKQLLGLIAEEDLLNNDAPDDPIGSLELSLERPFVVEDEHIYEVIKLIQQKKLTLIPVVDHQTKYLGAVTLSGIISFLAQASSISEPGSVIVLEMNKSDYSLSEIARLVEAENISILSSFITSAPSSTMLELTLKLSTSEITRLIPTFNRFGYTLKGSFQENDYMDDLKDNYDSLLNYLNI